MSSHETGEEDAIDENSSIATDEALDWPAKASTVQSSALSFATELICDLFLVLASLAVLAFALTVWNYNQRPIEDNKTITNALLKASKIGPSVLPILFACIIGRATHAILRWRLEMGESIGTLDLLAGSTSLTSVLTSQLKIRRISIVGLVLLTIWIISPIGGQASIRQVTVGPKVTVHNAASEYLVSTGNMTAFDNSDRMVYDAIANTLFLASVIAPASIKASPRDLWGNVKVLLIEEYEDKSTADDEGWFTTDESQSTYSSLVGVAMSNVSGSEFIDYSTHLETSYLSVDCPVVGYKDWYAGPDNSVYGNGAYIIPAHDSRPLTKVTDLQPRKFSYISWGPTAESNRIVTTTYLEMKVPCPTASTCAASGIRRSQLEHPPPAFTQIDMFPFFKNIKSNPTNSTYINWSLFASCFVAAVVAHPQTPTVVQNYLLEPNDPLSLTTLTSIGGTDKPLPSTEGFSARLGQLMNVYWTCLNGLSAISAGTQFASQPSSLLTTEGTKSISTTVLKCHVGWSVFLCLTSAIMILGSLVNPIFSIFISRGPDVMLNLSSLAARDNPHIPLPEGGSYMGAFERAKHLKDVKIKFGDAKPEDDMGYLAIGSLEGSIAQKPTAIQKRRLYQ